MLALFGDMITTDHISPAGSASRTTPPGVYLTERQVAPKDFNSYGSRRGNHEVMMRGTFANIRIKNEMLDGVEGHTTGPDGKTSSIYDAAMVSRRRASRWWSRRHRNTARARRATGRPRAPTCWASRR